MTGIDDSEFTVGLYSPVCSLCKHWDRSKSRACKAYPAEKSIPLEIWQGQHDHKTPYKGDNGVMFAQVTPADLEEPQP